MSVPLSYSTDKSLYAAKYAQGGRTVFGMAMTPNEIASLIKRPDPTIKNSGNRRISPDHAQGFARYFLDNEKWVAPGIILRAPSIFSFEEQKVPIANMEFGVMTFPERSQSDIEILDGQHRILGFHMALDLSKERIDKAHSHLARAKKNDPGGRAQRDAEAEIKLLEKSRARLFEDRISVEIQVVDDELESRQMFFDIAENAKGITSAVRARFDTRKVINRALAIVLTDSDFLENRVDLEMDNISRNNPNLYSARHVVEITRALAVGYEGRVSKRMEAEKNEQGLARSAIEFFDAIRDTFPAVK